jgi:hypothetical protein
VKHSYISVTSYARQYVGIQLLSEIESQSSLKWDDHMSSPFLLVEPPIPVSLYNGLNSVVHRSIRCSAKKQACRSDLSSLSAILVSAGQVSPSFQKQKSTL